MAYTSIDDPSEYFQTTLYTGNASSRSITNTGNSDLQPDWVWLKKRNEAQNHTVYDSTRGVSKILFPDGTDAEATSPSVLTAFNSDGFSLSADALGNDNNDTYVAWQWKCNGGTTTSVSAGTVDSNSTTACVRQVNTTAGFSIITYTADADGETFLEHGLGTAPYWVIVKDRGNAESWQVGHLSNTGTASFYNFLELDGNGASSANSNRWLNTAPTANLINIGGGNSVGGNGRNYVLYAFAPRKGYSQFGRWKGNGDVDGPFSYTGFAPRWLMVKNASGSGHWKINDTARDFNSTYGNDASLNADENVAEYTSASLNVDFLSNGFKIKSADGEINADGSIYVYMAFAEHPFVSSEGVPVTAGQ